MFYGVLGIKDPLRADVKAAVADCHRAGINVRMYVLVVVVAEESCFLAQCLRPMVRTLLGDVIVWAVAVCVASISGMCQGDW